MHERSLSVNLDPEIEAECLHDLSQHCSELTAKSEVRHDVTVFTYCSVVLVSFISLISRGLFRNR